jgi:hypothetical protein
MKITLKKVELLFLIGGSLLCFLIGKVLGFSSGSAFLFASGWFFGLLGSAYVPGKRNSADMPVLGILLLQGMVLSLVLVFGRVPVHSIVPLLIGYVLAFLCGCYLASVVRKRNLT